MNPTLTNKSRSAAAMPNDPMPFDPDRLREDLQDVYRERGNDGVNEVVAAELSARFQSIVPCPDWCDSRDDHPWTLPIGGPDPDPDRALTREHTADLVTLFGASHRNQHLRLTLLAEQSADPLQSVTAMQHVSLGLYGEIDGLTPSSLRHFANELSRAVDYLETLAESAVLTELAHVVAPHSGLHPEAT